MQSRWKVWFDSKAELVARKMLGQLLAHLRVKPLQQTIEPYAKGGYVASFAISHSASLSWPDAVVHLLSLAQSLGSGWLVVGSIEDGISLVVSKTGGGSISLPGVTMIETELLREAAA